ncbi:hypothetical protein B7494_g8088 [Chlorociboria aeruginascens]|nr:hypothetical protein B7494_g8088 [Chlorociboria aeruginascens]
MASAAPMEQYANQSGEHEYISEQSESGKSPLSMSLGFLKTLTEKKATKGKSMQADHSRADIDALAVDGQPPKRRGPKPDSKPALTRRQELNRQAQRTHRERKELYIKALEQEVLRLKDNFSTVTRDKELLAEENRQLKQLLAQFGIPWTGIGGIDELTRKVGTAYTSSGSISGSYNPGSQSYSPPPTHSSNSNPQFYGASPPELGNGLGRSMTQQLAQPGVDYDQAGIDFVLTLERPCMDHMQFLVERASAPEGDFCGHALMASCPPDPHLENHPEIPFGHNLPHSDGAQKTWDLSKGDLANLLDLSKRLDLDGEITPVMAWGMVLGHPRFSDFTSQDFKKLCNELGGKVRCYGFGAVLEDFEVSDAINNVFSAKSDPDFV